jgi:aminoglycoside phosphotransferase (APT) family kinase protein
MSDGEWRARIRWVVAHPSEPRVLLDRGDGDPALPAVERPGQLWTGDPAQVLPSLRELLGGDAVLLRCLEWGEDAPARRQRVTMLAVARAAAPVPAGTVWLGRVALAAAGPGADAALASLVAGELEDGRVPDGVPPWGARGWFDQAAAWLGASMERIGRPLTGPVSQARVWELSCLLRAPTAAGDVWFKANVASPLFVNEGVVMAALAGLLGDQVPAPLAVEEERGWMVLPDFGGELGWEVPDEVALEVARGFARLQVRAAPLIEELLAAGCSDRRLERLAAQAEAWLPAVEADGRLPAMDAASWLTSEEAAALGAAVPELRAACQELAGFAVPASLVHGDLHLANMAKGPGGYRFFDWTDACVAHPFLDLATIRRGTSFPGDDDEAGLRLAVRDAYLAEWASFEPPERLVRAWELALPLGALHQAVGYRSLMAGLRPPVDAHMAGSTAWWLRRVLDDLPSRPAERSAAPGRSLGTADASAAPTRRPT